MLASAAGYLVAAGALRPVERMRLRADAISAATPDARLPLAASRELRTPLTILKAEVALAVDAASSEDEMRGALASIGEEVDRLVRLAEDLLVIARGAASGMPVDVRPVDAQEVARRVVDRFAVVHPGAVVAEIEPGVVISGDRDRLEQAVSNLVDNALRHGAPPVVIGARRTGELVEIHVTDHGPGLNADDLARVDGQGAGRSARLEGGRAGGFGLGLAVVRAIASAHAGTLGAATSGAGADVWISLPVGGPAG